MDHHIVEFDDPVNVSCLGNATFCAPCTITRVVEIRAALMGRDLVLAAQLIHDHPNIADISFPDVAVSVCSHILCFEEILNPDAIQSLHEICSELEAWEDAARELDGVL